MTDGMPPGGWPMRMAITALVTEQWREIARMFLQLEATDSEEVNARTRRLLWNDIVERLQRGELVIRGVRAGAGDAETINPALLRGANPDYVTDTLEAAGTIFYAVNVFEADQAPRSAAASTAAAPEPSKGRLDYAAIDAPLLRAMREMIARGEASGPMNAARALVGNGDKVAGKGSADSKVKRLTAAYKVRGQTGQD